MSQRKEMIGGRIPEDTAEEFEDYRKRHDLNQTDALKRVVRRGLRVENGQEPPREVISGYLTTVGAVATVAAVWALFATSRALVPASLGAAAAVACATSYVVAQR